MLHAKFKTIWNLKVNDLSILDESILKIISLIKLFQADLLLISCQLLFDE